MDNSATANAIFAYKDKRVKTVEVCGTLIAIVAPPIGAMKSLLKALNGGTAAEIDAQAKNGMMLAANLMDSFPTIARYCVREAANPRLHVFQDDGTPEGAAELDHMLRDLPYDQALLIVTTASELMGLNPGKVESEVKNS